MLLKQNHTHKRRNRVTNFQSNSAAHPQPQLGGTSSLPIQLGGATHNLQLWEVISNQEAVQIVSLASVNEKFPANSSDSSYLEFYTVTCVCFSSSSFSTTCLLTGRECTSLYTQPHSLPAVATSALTTQPHLQHSPQAAGRNSTPSALLKVECHLLKLLPVESPPLVTFSPNTWRLFLLVTVRCLDLMVNVELFELKCLKEELFEEMPHGDVRDYVIWTMW
ncbi:hypothetical protein CMV_022033 [Castanea mollissima]|uniref:Uncharacterized protein n=1 Tax=Castanea mollissima TaxID=60419 RepID=A0A8J4QMY6_9ROSI|nr:hypothetical protein CMV_022033 [Castanea mollissima]